MVYTINGRDAQTPTGFTNILATIHECREDFSSSSFAVHEWLELIHQVTFAY